MSKRIPRYWINPKFRLNFPSFSVEWHLCDICDLELNELYDKERLVYGYGMNCIHAIVREGNSGLDFLYTNQTKFENIRVQKWLRETIRDHIVQRAKKVLPQRLHELESLHNLYANGIVVKNSPKISRGQKHCWRNIRIKSIGMRFHVTVTWYGLFPWFRSSRIE